VHRKHAVADAKGVARHLLEMDARVVLVCWEHHHLVDIVRAISKLATVTNPHDLPSAWPDDRFDVIWRFDNAGGDWTFSTLDQQLLHGDVFDA
jgi:hypothetical protein